MDDLIEIEIPKGLAVDEGNHRRGVCIQRDGGYGWCEVGGVFRCWVGCGW